MTDTWVILCSVFTFKYGTLKKGKVELIKYVAVYTKLFVFSYKCTWGQYCLPKLWEFLKKFKFYIAVLSRFFSSSRWSWNFMLTYKETNERKMILIILCNHQNLVFTIRKLASISKIVFWNIYWIIYCTKVSVKNEMFTKGKILKCFVF